MKYALACFPYDANANEIEHCRNLLQKYHHYRSDSLDRFEKTFDLAQLAPSEPNQRQQPSGFSCTPLLLGQVKMGILTSIHITMMYKEPTLRGCTFRTHATDYRCRETMAGINTLLKMLKKHEHPNFSNDSSYTKEEINTTRYFEPRFLTDTDCHIDNVAYSISVHCSETKHMPDATNLTPENMIFLTEIRKAHYDYVLNELNTRQVTYSKIKINNKRKHAKVGIKDLNKVLNLSVSPNEEVKSKSMSKEEQNVLKSFKPS